LDVVFASVVELFLPLAFSSFELLLDPELGAGWDDIIRP
jgi:hypothetical protein